MNNISLPVEAAKIAQDFRFIKKNYFTSKDDNLRYLRYRVLRPFLKMYNQILIKKYKNPPWLTPAAVEILDSILTKEMTGFEFGSGNSTIWIASRVKELTSIEHDKAWFEKIKKALQAKKILNVNYRLIEPEAQKKAAIKAPKNSYENIEMEYIHASCYEAYYNFLNSFSNESLDFVIVDGRARTECCQVAKNKIISGGFLLLDNSERRRYMLVEESLSGWPRIHTTTGLTDTTIWLKP